jgi:hypothetical protein
MITLLARYVSPTGSGYGILHQAAWWAHRDAAAELLRLGASCHAKSKDGTPADIAAQRAGEKENSSKHREFDFFLRETTWSNTSSDVDMVRIPVEMESRLGYPLRLTVLPSSPLGGHRAVSDRNVVVAYGGGEILIPAGTSHSVDDVGRPYVGWHGTLLEGMGMM